MLLIYLDRVYINSMVDPYTLAEELMRRARENVQVARRLRYRARQGYANNPIKPSVVRQTEYLRIKNSFWLAASMATRGLGYQLRLRRGALFAQLIAYQL